MKTVTNDPDNYSPIRMRRNLLLIAILLFVPLFIFNSYGFWQLLNFPGEINFGEGLQNAESHRVSNLAELYGDISKPPYWALTYPPFYHYLTEYVGQGTMIGQRLLTLLSSLGQWVIMIFILRRITGSYLPGILAVLMFVDSIFVAPWTVIGRTDMTGRFFSTAAIACAFLLRDYRKAFMLSLILSTLAVLTKQTMFTGGMVSAVILWQRNRKGAVAYAFVLGIAVIGSYLVLNAMTHGGFFTHVFTYTARGLDAEFFRHWVKTWCTVHWPYMVTGLIGIYVIIRFHKNQWWIIAALVPSMVNAIAIANPGGDKNYFFDLIWTLGILSAVGFWHFAGQFAESKKLAPSGIVVLLSIAMLVQSNTYAGIRARMVYPDLSFINKSNEVIREIKETPGPNLIEYAGYEIAAGQTPEFPAYIMKALEEKGIFDPTPIIDRIERKEFQMIMLSHASSHRYSPKVLATIKANYKVGRSIKYNYLTEGPADFYFLRPKTASDETTATISADTGTSVTPSS